MRAMGIRRDSLGITARCSSVWFKVGGDGVS